MSQSNTTSWKCVLQPFELRLFVRLLLKIVDIAGVIQCSMRPLNFRIKKHKTLSKSSLLSLLLGTALSKEELS